MISSRQCSQASCRAVLSSRSRSCAAGSRARAPRRLPLPARTVPAPPVQPFEQKMAWILRLEDQRILRGPSPAAAPAAPGSAAVTPASPPELDLGRLLTDTEARVRRRAALAVGRVGLPEGVPLLDAAAERCRSGSAADGGVRPRSDRRPQRARPARHRARRSVAARAGQRLRGAGPHRRSGRGRAHRCAAHAARRACWRKWPADADESKRDTPAAAFRLGLEALVRLKAYDALAAVVLDASGQPKVRWWPAAFALGRLEDKRALAGAPHAGRRQHSVHEGVCREGTRRPSRSRRPFRFCCRS